MSELRIPKIRNEKKECLSLLISMPIPKDMLTFCSLFYVLSLLFCSETVYSQQKKAPRPKPEVVLVIGGDDRNILKKPHSVAIDEKNKEILIADTGQDKVRIFDLSGIAKSSFDSKRPISVAVDNQDNIYIVQEDGRISICDFKGKEVKNIVISNFQGRGKPRISQIAVDKDGLLYLTDINNNVVIVTDSEGRHIKHFGSLEGEKGEEIRFEELFRFYLAGKRIYIIDIKTGKIYVFKKSDGELLFSFGEKGGAPGKLSMPSALVVDSKGRILVLDRKRHCISIYNELGEYQNEIGGEGKGKGWFYYPIFMTIDSEDKVYTCEHFMNRVQVMKIPEVERE